MVLSVVLEQQFSNMAAETRPEGRLKHGQVEARFLSLSPVLLIRSSFRDRYLDSSFSG